MFAISKDLYCVIQFLELPHDNVDGTVCVPYSWVRQKLGSTYVAYPVEDETQTEIRVRRRETAKREWKTYEASPLYITESYDNADNYIAKRITCLSGKKRMFPVKERKETKKLATTFKKPKINPASVKPAKPTKKKSSNESQVLSDDETLQNLTYSGEEDEVQLDDKFTQTDFTKYADKATSTSPDLNQPNASNAQNQRRIETSTNLYHLEPHIHLRRSHDVNLTRADSGYTMSEARYTENLHFPYRTLNPMANPQEQNFFHHPSYSGGMDGLKIFINEIDVRSNPHINVNIVPNRPYYDINQGALLQYQNYLPQGPRFQNNFPPPIFYPPQYPHAYDNQRIGEGRNSLHVQTQTYSNQQTSQMQSNDGNRSDIQQESYSTHTAGERVPNNNNNVSSYTQLETPSNQTPAQQIQGNVGNTGTITDPHYNGGEQI